MSSKIARPAPAASTKAATLGTTVRTEVNHAIKPAHPIANLKQFAHPPAKKC